MASGSGGPGAPARLAGGGGHERRRLQGSDRHVGRRIRERRILLGLTQRRVAELVGVTYKQVRLYETGAHRISAGRLFHLARALRVEVGHFYEGLDGAPAAGREPESRRLLELARDVAAIAGPRRREALCHLARVMAGAEPAAEPAGEAAGAR
jgi:transcriptional regulator with XRE-family HTH domain